jgi:beta-glucosidase
VSPGGALTAKVTVKNIGPMDGDEVVQLYAGCVKSGVAPRAVKELKGFKRVHVRAGREAVVTIRIRAADLAWYNPDRGRWEVERTKYRLFAGPSSGELPLKKDFIVG